MLPSFYDGSLTVGGHFGESVGGDLLLFFLGEVHLINELYAQCHNL